MGIQAWNIFRPEEFQNMLISSPSAPFIPLRLRSAFNEFSLISGVESLLPQRAAVPRNQIKDREAA